jgi:hypothetical protein
MLSRAAMEAGHTLVGEGKLGWGATLGGKAALVPALAGYGVIALLAWAERGTWYALALGALVPTWWVWRVGLIRNAVHAMRHGRSTFRVELDDVGARTIHGGHVFEVEWFAFERFQENELGIVLLLRVAKNGANAIFAPKSFFAPADWEAALALVREKLPGSAKRQDDVRQAEAERRAKGLRELPWRLAIVVLGLGALYFLGQALR